MRESVLRYAALALVVLFCHPAAAETIVMGADWHYPPHQYLDEDGQPAGFDVEIFRAIAEDQGLNPDFYLGDWGEVQQKLSDRKIDLVPMFITESRSRKYLFSAPFMNEYYLLMAKRGTRGHSSLDELDSETIALQHGGFIWNHVQEHHPSLNLVKADTEPEAITQLLENKATYALVSVHVGSYVVAENEYENIVSVSPPLVAADYAFAVSQDNAELVGKLNQGLKNIRASGAYDDIYQKWVRNLSKVYEAYQKGWKHSLWIIILLALLGIALLIAVAYFRGLTARLAEWGQDLKKRTARAEIRANQLTQFDSVTNLPKRRMFTDYLQSVIGARSRSAENIGVCFVAITDYSRIQLILGFPLAESYTRAVAERLEQKTSKSMFISYFGDGKFGLIIEQPGSREGIYNEIFNIVRSSEGRVVIRDLPIDVNLSCGLAFYPEHGDDPEVITRAAEMASGVGLVKRTSLTVYNPGMEPDTRQVSLMSDLRTAIQNDTLGWAFQPIFSFKSNKVAAVEMLVRWEHPDYGQLAPDLFIPLAEESGTIRYLTRHLIIKAAKFQRDWQERGLDISLSINVSSKDLIEPELSNEILNAFKDVNHNLTMEITETAMIEDLEAILENIQKLRNVQINIALDDFGTGYSSLVHLRRIKPDEIKIDRDFVKALCESAEDEKIVDSIIKLGHELGALVVAEGVESTEVMEKLREMGCDAVQGYAIAAPMRAYELAAFCENSRLCSGE